MKTVRSVLIVDDNPGDILLCKMALEESGRFPCILEASQAESAAAMFERYEESKAADPDCFPPVVILLDINMPRMDGFEFLERLDVLAREAGWGDESPAVVMLTSSSDPRDRGRAEAFPLVCDFVTKPPTEAFAISIAERFGEAR